MKVARLALILCLAAGAAAAQKRAKNVILFLGDAGGLPTISAASIHGYGQPQKLYLQRMPHIGLSDTSSSHSWVTDSAAGMTAIVTGAKTRNGAVSVTPDPEPGQKDLTPLKTILEYAEQQGLSTGVVTNMNAADATPAACYSHVDSRRKFGEIFAQVWKPRFGDGIDVVFGAGRSRIIADTKELGFDIQMELRRSGRDFYDSIAAVPPHTRRVVALMDNNVDVSLATERAIQILSKNLKGFFLMVEWDLHPTRPEQCLNTVVALDKLIERTARQTNPNDTLIMFTADHSFDLRLLNGRRGVPLSFPAQAKAGGQPEEKPVRTLGGAQDTNPIRKTGAQEERPMSNFAIGTSHSGEEVLVAAQGPGSKRVRGFMSNTDLFKVMMGAFRWTADKQ